MWCLNSRGKLEQCQNIFEARDSENFGLRLLHTPFFFLSFSLSLSFFPSLFLPSFLPLSFLLLACSSSELKIVKVVVLILEKGMPKHIH